MKRRVVAIGLDAADPDMLERWFAMGELPNLHELQRASTSYRFVNTVRYRDTVAPYGATEGSWVALQSGVKPMTTGYWETVRYDPTTYALRNDPVEGGYDYREFPPFFALGDDYRVAVFDLPVSARADHVSGVQVLGWGGHYPYVRRESQPADLLAEINDRFGKNEVVYNDYGVFWKPNYQRWLEAASLRSVRARAKICHELLDREPWDLFAAVFGESHGAAHDLWFASDPTHPVHAAWTGDHDPLLNVYRALDDAVGSLAKRAGPDDYFLCYSPHGMQPNVTDVCDFILLPELLYRFNFPGQVGFDPADSDIASNGSPPPPQLSGKHWYWFGDIWRQRHMKSALMRRLRRHLPGWLIPPNRDFHFPYLQDWFGAAGWIPAVWYRPAWSRMRSFALPSYADGHVRINVAGRETHGIVDPSEYEAECERVSNFLRGVTDARSGLPLVHDVIRTRTDPLDPNPRLPNADLMIVWQDRPVDVVDGPGVGRVGPFPYYRSGGHRNCGFMMIRGPGVPAGETGADVETVDFAPTVLDMLGAPIPEHFEGRSLMSQFASTCGR